MTASREIRVLSDMVSGALELLEGSGRLRPSDDYDDRTQLNELIDMAGLVAHREATEADWLNLAAFCAAQIAVAPAPKPKRVRVTKRVIQEHVAAHEAHLEETNGRLDHSPDENGRPRNTVIVPTEDGGFNHVAVEDVMKAAEERAVRAHAASPDRGKARKSPFPVEAPTTLGVFRCAACGAPKPEAALHPIWQGGADLCLPCGDARFGEGMPKDPRDVAKLQADWERFCKSVHRET